MKLLIAIAISILGYLIFLYILAVITWTPTQDELIINQQIGGDLIITIDEFPDIHGVDYSYSATYNDENGVPIFEWSESMGTIVQVDSNTQIIETNSWYILPYQTIESARAFVVNKNSNEKFTYSFNKEKLWNDSLLYNSEYLAPNSHDRCKSKFISLTPSNITVDYLYVDPTGEPLYLKITYQIDENSGVFRSVKIN